MNCVYILTSVINGPKRDHKLKIFSVSRQCRESKESDFFRNIIQAQLQLPPLTVLLWWLGRKWCSMPTTGCCVKIPEPKRANSKNKQRFYKELTRRGHSKVKLSQAHFFYFTFPATTVPGQKRDCQVFCWRGGQNINSNSFKISWPAPDPSLLVFVWPSLNS